MPAYSSSSPADRRLYRQVWTLSWPVILANVSIPLAGAVDTAVVGHLPNVALIGAVGIGALIFGFLYWVFAFLRMATTGFVAQDTGRGDHQGVRDHALRAVLLGALLGLGLIVFQDPVARLFLAYVDAEAEVESLARIYYDVRIWGAPAALVNLAVLGVLFGQQRMKAAFATQVLLNSVNVVLDVVFVVGFEWSVEGVALATAIAEYVAAALALWLLVRGLPRPARSTDARGVDWRRVFDVAVMGRMLRISFDIMLRSFFALVMTLHFMSTSASMGNVTLAVNTILMHFFTFLAFGLDGFAHAVEALGGSAFGRRERAAFEAAVRTCLVLSVVVAAVYMAIYALAGPPIFGLMTDIEEVLEASRAYLPWMVAMPLVGVWSFLLDGIFIGTTHAREMRNGMALSLAAYLAAVWLLVDALEFANHGLWAAMVVFMVVRAVTLALWYPRILVGLR